MNTEEKARELGQKYFPNELNIWARCNIEAQKVEFACLEMAEWKDQQFAKHGYTKEQLLNMGFGFTLNGDIVTPK